MMKIGPPTTLTVMIVVAADRPYIILLPKLSDKLLSIPEDTKID
jgi:hypothetical protein